MTIFLNILLILISIFIGYFVDCVSNEKMIFIEDFLSEKSSSWILNHSRYIIGVALASNIIIYLFSQRRFSSKKEKQLYEAICAKVFSEVITSNDNFDPSDWKVTIMQACKRKSENPYLKCVGRHQTKTPVRQTKVRFKVGEGCAGIAYKVNQLVRLSINCYNPDKPGKYLADCEKILNLPRKKALQLNEKCAGYLCIPLLFVDYHQPWGILSIDCTKKDLIESIDARSLETLMSHFSTFFREKY